MPKDASPSQSLTVSLGQHSEAGRKPLNQDFHGAVIPERRVRTLKGIAVAIADGISTSPVSRQAAETAIKSLLDDYYCTSDAWTVRVSATRVIAATNAWLYGMNRTAIIDDANRGYVCTLSALILKGRNAHILHVGDSRIWRVAGRSLEQLTKDHTTTLSPEESFLIRALGAEPEVEVDYAKISLSPGDTFILTTDGVHEHWQPREVLTALEQGETLDAAAQEIAGQALAAGSPDNLTVQIVRVETLPDPESADILGQAAVLPVLPLPKEGEIVDGFRILRRVHANNRSHIFLAVGPDDACVALKVPATETKEDPAYMRRFLMEEWIARRLASPHVLRAAAAPEKRSGHYVVTEFVEGQTLRQWMIDNPAPSLTQVRDLVSQIIRGVRAFHRKQMLHQDLRPENIMIDREGTVKIIDLGSTRVEGVQEALRDPDNEILGTLQYSAPEYFSGDPIGPRSDQFSLGVIVYEMLTGHLPYGAEAARVRSRRDAARLTFRTAQFQTNNVPDWIDEVLRRAVHPDPTRRFAALSEFDTALRNPSGRRPFTRMMPLTERYPVSFWQATTALLAAICVILLATR
ncbi:MAG: protein kinase [Pseudomonadota bacterium]